MKQQIKAAVPAQNAPNFQPLNNYNVAAARKLSSGKWKKWMGRIIIGVVLALIPLLPSLVSGDDSPVRNLVWKLTNHRPKVTPDVPSFTHGRPNKKK